MTNATMKWFRESLDLSGSAVHSPSYPADVREGDPVSARLAVRVNGAVQEHPVRVWRLSPFGVELLEGSSALAVDLDSEVQVSLRLGERRGEARGRVVKTRPGAEGQRLIGIRWQREAAPESRDGDRRGSRRWPCGAEFPPTGSASNPARLDDVVYFRVRDVSRDGMQIVTSLRNKFVVPGMVLESSVAFPGVGEVRVDLEVVDARPLSESGTDRLAVGVRARNLSPESLQSMGQYILQFGAHGTVKEIKQSGFSVQSASRAVDFSYVRTVEEYAQVLKLRKTAYVGAEKLPADIYTGNTADDFDTRARILIGCHRGDVVASLRLMFHEIGDPMEHEEFIQLPGDFPPKDKIIEITRVCTHPGYRGSDILFELFRYALVAATQSGRRWVLGSSTAKLLPLYRRIGCQVTDLRYSHETLGGEEHTIFLGDVERGLSGRGVGPFVWNAMYADIWNHLDVSELVEVGPLARARLGVYRLFGPATRVLARRRSRPRKRKPSR